MREISFNPGPTEIHPKVPLFIEEGLRQRICSLSHRSKHFEQIMENAVLGLKELLSIPQSHQVFFLGSATEAMERVIENCVEQSSFHFVNGAFSERFLTIARELRKKTDLLEVLPGTGIELSSARVPAESELICVTHNETSTGVMLSADEISRLKGRYPGKLIAVDVVSSAPYGHLDFSALDCVFFSVQKGFGLPAGLGVLVVSTAALEKSAALEAGGLNIGSYHKFSALRNYAEKKQTPETPNVLGIYLLTRVCQEYLQIGRQRLMRETDQKAALLYDFLDRSENFTPFVSDKRFRSPTVVAFETTADAARIKKTLQQGGLVLGSGYGKFKEKQLRIANFPPHTMSDMESVIDWLGRA